MYIGIVGGIAAGHNTDTIKTKLDNAESFLGNDSPEKAIKIIDDALQARSKDERALYLKGQALSMMGDYYEAVESYDLALSINPDNAEAMAGKCNALIEAKECAEGENCCCNLVKMDPESETYRIIAGNALKNPACFEPVAGNERSESEYYNRSVAYFNEALLLNNNSTYAWNNKGVALGELGTTIGDSEQVNESLACFDAAIRINSSFAEAWNNKGVTLDRWGKWETSHSLRNRAEVDHQNALKCYDNALAIDADLAEAMFNKAETLGLNESTSDYAQEYYNKAIEIKTQLKKEMGWAYIEISPEISRI